MVSFEDFKDENDLMETINMQIRGVDETWGDKRYLRHYVNRKRKFIYFCFSAIKQG